MKVGAGDLRKQMQAGAGDLRKRMYRAWNEGIVAGKSQRRNAGVLCATSSLV